MIIWSKLIFINDLNTFGYYFEAMAIRDLRIYAEANDWNIFHYQDYDGNEFDAVIEFSDGDYAAFEIKLGANQIEEAANAVYTREDGVIVIPITALKD